MSAYIVMGVSGCGKSTVAMGLANKIGGVYLDADDFHPPANKEKMAAGIPLTDDDRWEWLDALNTALRERSSETVFLACSALRKVYRDRLRNELPELQFIYLKGSKELIRQRLEARKGHYMPPSLLDSQFSTLEEPDDALIVKIDQPMPAMIEEAWRAIGTAGRP